jgi:hypothetical protein
MKPDQLWSGIVEAGKKEDVKLNIADGLSEPPSACALNAAGGSSVSRDPVNARGRLLREELVLKTGCF